jgi:hypothetical protein
MSNRRQFFLTYFSFATFSFVVIFYGAPVVRGSIPNERFDNMVQACRADAPLTRVFVAMIEPLPEPPSDNHYISKPDPVQRASVPPNRPARIPASVSRATTPPAPVQSQPDPEPPHAGSNTMPSTASSFDYNCMWAVVKNDTAAVYDSSGNLTQELGPGSLVQVAAVRTNQSESLAVCRYDTMPASLSVALIRTRDLALRNGSLNAAKPDLVSLLVKEARLEMEIRAARASIASDLARRNPHTESFNKARSDCLAFNERAKAMRTKAESCQGSARMEVMDKLRSMKEEESLLRRTYESAKRAYEKWNDGHTATTNDGDSVRSLQMELTDVRTRIGRIEEE